MEVSKFSAAGAIKNPLTIIAIFAGIAEISGTLVLPHIAPDNQFLYIWFLMTFPSILVVIFFLTLNFNHRVLYAPSDFKDEGHFMEVMRKATQIEVLNKASREASESNSQIIADEAGAALQIPPSEDPPTATETRTVSTPSPEKSTPDVLYAKPASVEKIFEERIPEYVAHGNLSDDPATPINTPFRASQNEIERVAIRMATKQTLNENPIFDIKIGESEYVFDAVTTNSSSIIAWESFAVSTLAFAEKRARKFFANLASAADNFPTNSKTTLGGALVPVLSPSLTNVERQQIVDKLRSLTDQFRIPTVVVPMQVGEVMREILNKRAENEKKRKVFGME